MYYDTRKRNRKMCSLDQYSMLRLNTCTQVRFLTRPLPTDYDCGVAELVFKSLQIEKQFPRMVSLQRCEISAVSPDQIIKMPIQTCMT